MFSEKFRVSQLNRISKYRNYTAVAVAVVLYLEILRGVGGQYGYSNFF